MSDQRRTSIAKTTRRVVPYHRPPIADPMPCGDCPLLAHCSERAVACAGWRRWTVTGKAPEGLLCVGLLPLDEEGPDA